MQKIVKTVWVKYIRCKTSCGQSKFGGDSMKKILRSKNDGHNYRTLISLNHEAI